MRGSLDDPPIVVRGALWKTLLMLAGAIGFVMLGLWLMKIGPMGVFAGLLSIGFFGACAILGIVRLFKPVFVALAPERVIWFDGWRTHSFAWSDFGGMVIVQVRSSRMLSFQIAPGSGKTLPLGGASRALAGVDGTFPVGLEINPDELADLVLQAGERWGGFVHRV